LYKEFPDPTTGKPILRFVISTTAPNSVVSLVHDRMAAMLKRKDEAKWLDPGRTEPTQLLPLLAPYSVDEMECYQVGRAIGKNTND